MLTTKKNKDIDFRYDFNRFNSTIKFLHIKNVLENILGDSTKAVFVSNDLLETLSVTIDDLKNNMEITVIQQCQHFNYSTETWVGAKGYWINKKNKNIGEMLYGN